MEDMNSDMELKDMLRNELDLILVLDLAGNIIASNLRVLSILDYSFKELEGKSIVTVYSVEFRDRVEAVFSSVLEGKVSYCPFPFESKGHVLIPVDSQIMIKQWKGEKVIVSCSICFDPKFFFKEMFQTLLDSMQMVMGLITIDSRIFLNVNLFFEKKLGYTMHDISGYRIEDLNYLKYPQERTALVKQFNEKGEAYGEATILSKDGKEFYFQLFLSTVKIYGRDYILFSGTDITECKQLQNHLIDLNNQEKLRTSVGLVFNKMIFFDEKINQVLSLLGEYTQMDRIYLCCFSAGLNSAYIEHIWRNKGIEASGDPALSEFSIKNINWKKIIVEHGNISYCNLNYLKLQEDTIFKPRGVKSLLIYPIYLNNKVCEFIGFESAKKYEWDLDNIKLLWSIKIEISNALQNQVYLTKAQKSEAMLRMALSAVNEGIWDWDEQTKTFKFSDNCYKLFGYKTRDDVDVNMWTDLIQPDDFSDFHRAFKAHLKGKTEMFEALVRIKGAEGDWHWALVHGKVVARDRYLAPLRVMGTIRNVTEHQNIEEKLRELLSTKDKLFSIISHDLRGPICGLMQITELLNSDDEIAPEIQAEFIREMKNTTKSTFDLLENLLNWSRLQCGTFLFNPQSFTVNGIIKENILLFANLAKRKNIALSFDDQPLLTIYADYHMINIVVRNLMSNAVKFTRAGGSIKVIIVKNDGNVEVSVVDDGVGIPEERRIKLFNSHDFITTNGTSHEKGSGLGLELCKDFITRNHGTIWVESTEGKGSIFTFKVPFSVRD